MAGNLKTPFWIKKYLEFKSRFFTVSVKLLYYRIKKSLSLMTQRRFVWILLIRRPTVLKKKRDVHNEIMKCLKNIFRIEYSPNKAAPAILIILGAAVRYRSWLEISVSFFKDADARPCRPTEQRSIFIVKIHLRLSPNLFVLSAC